MERLINATIQIMKELDIAIRPSYMKDGKIKLKVWDQIQGLNADFRIQSDINGIMNPDSLCEMYYTDPIILTGPSLMKILAVFTNTKENVKARSIIVHELTHWLQKGTLKELHTTEGYIQFNGYNYLEYIFQIIEIDAHAVQAFYFLKEFNKERLEEIKTNSATTDTLKRNLINEFMIQNGKEIVFK